MKTMNVFVGIMLMSMITLNGFSQKKEEITPLEITGAALLNDVRTSNYAVSVYLDGTKIDSLYKRNKRTVHFYVKYNQVYTFLFQKEGCKDKVLIVNTNIPQGLKEIHDDNFNFEVEMTEILAKKSEEIEDYPVAVLKICKEKESLTTSESYYKFTHQNWDLTTINIADTSPAWHTKKNK